MHDRRLHAGEAPPARAYVCLSLRSGVSALLCSRADRVIHRKSVISRHTQKKVPVLRFLSRYIDSTVLYSQGAPASSSSSWQQHTPFVPHRCRCLYRSTVISFQVRLDSSGSQYVQPLAPALQPTR